MTIQGQRDSQGRRVEIIDRVRDALQRAATASEGRARPFVTLTYAQSLDGSIALSGGGKLLLSNRQSQELTHQIRALHDAILVGINTVLSDDPRLNVRLAEGDDPQPVVVDTCLRFPLAAKLLRDPCVRPIVVAGEGLGCAEKERQLLEARAEILRVPLRADGSVDLGDLLVRLGRRGLRSVMIEGGAEIITSILTSHLADQFLVTIAPRFVGGLRAVKSRKDGGQGALPRLDNVDYQWFAGDLVLRGDLHLDRGRATSDDRTSDERREVFGESGLDASLEGKFTP